MGLSNALSCEAGSFLILPLLQPPQVISVRGFEALFPCAGTLGCMVCLAPQLFFPVYLHAHVGPPAPPAAASPAQSSRCEALLSIFSTLAACLHPSCLNECFFFNSLVVGLPYSSTFCQFWLFFVFKFVVVLLLVV